MAFLDEKLVGLVAARVHLTEAVLVDAVLFTRQVADALDKFVLAEEALQLWPPVTEPPAMRVVHFVVFEAGGNLCLQIGYELFGTKIRPASSAIARRPPLHR